MKRSSRSIELAFFLSIIACLSLWYQDASKPSEIPLETSPDHFEVKAQWYDQFAIAQQALERDELLKAERALVTAEFLARGLNAGDSSLAQTLDDLGQVNFRMGKFKKAEDYQGQAVAALLLAKGPEAEELSIYIQRYGWAQKAVQKAHAVPTTPPAVDFLSSYSPGYSENRLKQELSRLRGEYAQFNDQDALLKLDSFQLKAY